MECGVRFDFSELVGRHRLLFWKDGNVVSTDQIRCELSGLVGEVLSFLRSIDSLQTNPHQLAPGDNGDDVSLWDADTARLEALGGAAQLTRRSPAQQPQVTAAAPSRFILRSLIRSPVFRESNLGLYIELLFQISERTRLAAGGENLTSLGFPILDTEILIRVVPHLPHRKATPCSQIQSLLRSVLVTVFRMNQFVFLDAEYVVTNDDRLLTV